MGTNELYGELVDHGHISLRRIKELVNLLKENGIELPDTKKFRKYSFNSSHGWGKPFEWKGLSEVFTGMYD
jgi:hypothetical protein